MPRFRTLVATLCVLPLLLIGLGCYETQYPLGSADKATVDAAYVGDYATTDGNKTSTVIIRNIDNHLYYVEWIDSGDNKPDRMVGYTAQVNGVVFANLHGFTDDGSIDPKYLVMRIALSSDHKELSLRNLKEDFFKDKNIDSSATLEKVIGENLENHLMYDGDAVVATRVTAPDSRTPTGPPPHSLP